MKISELLSEQIAPVGSTGSTSGSPGSVGQVSQTPPKTSPYSPSKPPGATDSTQKTDPNREQLAKILAQNNVKPEEMETATAALQAAFTNPNSMDDKQKEILGKLTPSFIKNPATLTALKGSVAALKPTSTAPGTPE